MLCDICGKPFDPIKGMFLCNPRVHEGEEMPKFHVLTERAFLNGKRDRIVPQDSPDAAFFLGPEGHTIPYDYAEKLGLVESEKSSSPVSEDDPPETPGELSPRALHLLREAGYTDPNEIRFVDDQTLLAHDGVGPSMLKDYRAVYPFEDPEKSEQPKVDPPSEDPEKSEQPKVDSESDSKETEEEKVVSPLFKES